MAAVVRDRRPLPEQLRGPLSQVPASRQLPAAEDDPAPDIRILRDGLRRTRRGIPPIRTISGCSGAGTVLWRSAHRRDMDSAVLPCSVLHPRRAVFLPRPGGGGTDSGPHPPPEVLQRHHPLDHNYNALLEVSDEVLLLSDGYVHQVRDRSDLVRYGYCR